MASSGSLNTTGYEGRYLNFSWQQTSQSIANNTTTISWTLKGAGQGEVGYYTSGNFKVVIDGTTVYSSSTRIDLYNGTVVASGTKTFTHNADGTQTFAVSVEAGIYTVAVNCSGSATFTLNTIARASQPSCITWPEHTQNVGEFGDTISIHMNRKASNLTHTVRYQFGEQSGTIATNVGTGTTWTIPLSLMNLIPNTTSGSGTIYVDTYNGSTLVGTKYCGFTATVPADVKPAITSVALTDITQIDSIYGSPVKGLSKIEVNVLNVKLAYSSPIKAYKITANGVTYSSKKITTGFLLTAGSSPVTIMVTDGRGRTGSWSYDMNVQDYAAPNVSRLTVKRCDSDGTANDQGEYCQLSFDASVSSMNNKNLAEYVVRYKKTSETSWTTITTTGINNVYSLTDKTYIFAADDLSPYDIEVTATDRHSSMTRTTTTSTAFSLIDFHPGGKGIKFGGIAQRENAVEFGMDIYDQHDTVIRNGWAHFTGSGNDAIDPNTTTDHIILTNKNTPGNQAYYIKTEFYRTASTDELYRTQMALPYHTRYTSPHTRCYYNGAWTEWQKLITMNEAWPVGSIYLAYNKTNPSTLFGGTWVRIENAFLWAIDDSGAIGMTGGEKTHTLTVNELPAHTHGSVYSQHANATKNAAWYTTEGDKIAYGTVSTGGGAAHNNMPPYIQVSVWRRTA